MIGAGLFSTIGKAQANLQAKFDALILRQTNLAQIEKLFGQPDSNEKSREWTGKLSPDGMFRGFSFETKDCRAKPSADLVKRNVYNLRYQDLGIFLTIFDNPSGLYSVRTINPEISVLNIRIGDDYAKVEQTFGKGELKIEREGGARSLTYRKKNVRFTFWIDPTADRLNKSKALRVLEIEVFDGASTFGGCP